MVENALESAVEAETGDFFENFQKAVPIHLTFKELSHNQTEIFSQTENSCTAGIANHTVQQYWSKSIGICFYWVMFLDQTNLLSTGVAATKF